MGYTLYNAELTLELKNIVLDFVLENNASPTGIWRDFHCVHRSWRNLGRFVDAGLLAVDDLPDEPDATDYPDVSSAATLQCPETCCLPCDRIPGCDCVNCAS